MAEVSICIKDVKKSPSLLFFSLSPTESSTLVLFSADDLPALLKLLFYGINLLSHLTNFLNVTSLLCILIRCATESG